MPKCLLACFAVIKVFPETYSGRWKTCLNGIIAKYGKKWRGTLVFSLYQKCGLEIFAYRTRFIRLGGVWEEVVKEKTGFPGCPGYSCLLQGKPRILGHLFPLYLDLFQTLDDEGSGSLYEAFGVVS